MEPSRSQKPHAVLVPFPAQGHINPLMQLAELLHSRGFHITFVYTESHTNRLVRSKGPGSLQGLPDFQFETIPDGLPPPDRPDKTWSTARVCDSIRKHSPGPFKELLVKLNSSPDVPLVTCVISDAVMSFALKPAQELGIVEVQFWTASACGFMGYYQFAELVTRGIVPLKDDYKSNGCLETPLDWIESMKGFKLKDLPHFCHVTDPQDIMLHFMIEQIENCKISSGLILNTFDELEPEVLSELSPTFPPIYTIGPLLFLARKKPETINPSIDSTLWKENAECFKWLDTKKERSVVYVNFGSTVFVTEKRIEEFAWGLAASGLDFLWVLRPNIVEGEAAKLPEGFLEAVRDRGLIVNWCSQEQVLSHGSVGLFVTHAGWNSMLETVWFGVPVLCYPLGAEQPTNSRSVDRVWGNGMVIEEDVDRDKLARLVKEMMSGEKGVEKRERALEWKKKAEEAIGDHGGSSFSNLEKLVNEVILQKT